MYVYVHMCLYLPIQTCVCMYSVYVHVFLCVYMLMCMYAYLFLLCNWEVSSTDVSSSTDRHQTSADDEYGGYLLYGQH